MAKLSHFDKPTLNRHWNQLMYLIDIIDYEIVNTTTYNIY